MEEYTKPKKQAHYKYVTMPYIATNKKLTRKKSIKFADLGVYKHKQICNNATVGISGTELFCVQAFCICLLSGLISTINLGSKQIQGAYFYT